MGGSTTTTIPAGEKLAGIQLQTSTYGKALPLLYGKNRVPASLIWHDDFKAIKHVEKQKSSGGKGGGGSTTTKTESWTYEASVMLAICHGPIAANGIGKCWADKAVGALNSTATGSGWSLFVGNYSQAPWSWLASRHPSKAVGYAGTVVLANPKLDLGSSGALKNYSFEVSGFLSDSAYNGDAHPAQILTDFLDQPLPRCGLGCGAHRRSVRLRRLLPRDGFFRLAEFRRTEACAGAYRRPTHRHQQRYRLVAGPTENPSLRRRAGERQRCQLRTERHTAVRPHRRRFSGRRRRGPGAGRAQAGIGRL